MEKEVTGLVIVDKGEVKDYSGAEDDEQLINLFLSTFSSTSTIRAYSGDLSSFLMFLQKLDCDLKSLKLKQLVNYTVHLEKQALAKATKKRRIAAIKSLLSFAHGTGYTQFNVGAALKTKRAPDTRAEKILSELEINKMLEHAKPLERIIILFLYGSAVRVDELTKLRWMHVHWGSPLGAITLDDPKGERTRTVPVAEEYLNPLKELKTWGSEEEYFVFGRRYPRPISASYVTKLIKLAADRAGIKKKISPHWLRHSHASHAAARGTPVHYIQQQLGHASVETTSIYMHVNPKEGTGLFLKVGKKVDPEP